MALGQGDTLEKEMATHSSSLAWEILRTEEPGSSQWGCKRFRHNLATKQQLLLIDGFMTSRWSDPEAAAPTLWTIALKSPLQRIPTFSVVVVTSDSFCYLFKAPHFPSMLFACS